MILDALTLVSNAQAVTVTAVSTNTIDLSQARDMGAGQEVCFGVTVDENFATATSVEIQVITSASANLSSPTVIGSTGALAIAQLTAGRKPIEVKIPRAVLLAQPIGQRYLGLNYVVGGSNATAGKFTAAIYAEGFADVAKNYPVGYSIT
jgi:hypothetical protein